MALVGCGIQQPTLQPPLILPTATPDLSTVDGAMFDVTVEPIATQEQATLDRPPTPTRTLEPLDSSDVTPVSVSGTGIRGEVTMQSDCPPDAEDCEDQPFPGVVRIFNAEGQLVAVVQANIRGRFSQRLDPGIYLVFPEPGPGVQTSGEQTVEVIEGEFTTVRIQYAGGRP